MRGSAREAGEALEVERKAHKTTRDERDRFKREAAEIERLCDSAMTRGQEAIAVERRRADDEAQRAQTVAQAVTDFNNATKLGTDLKQAADAIKAERDKATAAEQDLQTRALERDNARDERDAAVRRHEKADAKHTQYAAGVETERDAARSKAAKLEAVLKEMGLGPSLDPAEARKRYDLVLYNAELRGATEAAATAREEVVKERYELTAEQNKLKTEAARLQAYDVQLQGVRKNIDQTWTPHHVHAFVTAAVKSCLKPHKSGDIDLGMVLHIYNPTPFPVRIRNLRVELNGEYGLKHVCNQPPDAFIVAPSGKSPVTGSVIPGLERPDGLLLSAQR